MVAELHCNHEDKFYIIKYVIGSKTLLKSTKNLLKQAVEYEFNRAGTKISLEELKKEWISNDSELFAELMLEIEGIL